MSTEPDERGESPPSNRTDVQAELRRVLVLVHAPGVVLPPWSVETDPGNKGSARQKSIGIMGGCVVEHDHNDEDEACVLTEFAVVWNNNCSLPAMHRENAGEVATARAMAAAFNFLARYGAALLR